MVASLPNHIATLQTQASHWLASASQSLEHSQISNKASPSPLEFLNRTANQRWSFQAKKTKRKYPGAGGVIYAALPTERYRLRTFFFFFLQACLPVRLPGHNLQKKQTNLQSAPIIIVHIQVNGR